MFPLYGAQWWEAVPAVFAPAVLVALYQTAKALKAQAAASDLQTVLNLWERFDALWIRFRAAQSDPQKEFEFGQLTSYYELACGLFRDDILSTDAARTLKEHLRDILPAMFAHPDFAQRFKRLSSRPDTYENIKWFMDNHTPPATKTAANATPAARSAKTSSRSSRRGVKAPSRPS